MKSIWKKACAFTAVAALCLFAAGCGSTDNSNNTKAQQEKKEVTLGVTPGPQAEIAEEVKKEAAKQGITIRIMEFSDYVTPDVALSDRKSVV